MAAALALVLAAVVGVPAGSAALGPTATASTARVRVLSDVFGRVVPPRPRLLLLPPVTRLDPGRAALPPDRLAAFGETFAESLADTYTFRRWDVVGSAEVRDTIAGLGFGEACRNLACLDAVVARTGASHWMSVVVVDLGPAGCAVRVKRYDVLAGRLELDREAAIETCDADRLAVAGAELGRSLADGPRRSPPIALELTPRSIPDLAIPDIPDLADVRTATAGPRAIDDPRWEARRLVPVVIEGRLLITRGGAPLGDCEVLRAAELPVDDALDAHCHGNLWEAAWTALPIGLLTMIGTTAGTVDGDGAATAVFGLGAVAAVVGPVLALVLDRDAAPPDEHALDEASLRRAVERANEQLATRLGLAGPGASEGAGEVDATGTTTPRR